MNSQICSSQKTVVVLGPPRSGTSVTAGILESLGVDMGNLRGADSENPKGYFEDKDFLSLGDDIYQAASPGSHGFKPPPIENILRVKEQFEGRIKKLLEKRAEEARMRNWGWKATSTILTIEIFLPYLENPHFIVVFRNPLHIAESIVKYTKNKPFYNELNIFQALKIVNQYYHGIYTFLHEHNELPLYFISFEELTSDPVKETEGLARFLNMPVTPAQLERIKRLITPKHEMLRLKKRFRRKERLRYMYRAIKSPHKFWGYLNEFISKFKIESS